MTTSQDTYTPGVAVVLVAPQIPPNTGSIARTCAALNLQLHLIKPLGFEISDKHVRRAGLDYWPWVKLSVHDSWEKFLQESGCLPHQLYFFTTKTSKSYIDATYKDGDFLVFGSETTGLSSYFHSNYHDQRLTIPIDNPHVRSLNLASSVSVAVYEARRQLSANKITS